MRREFPKQAFAAREAHEALREIQKLVDDAAKKIHAAELESFSVAMNRKHDDDIRRTLQNVIDQLESPNFDAMLTTVRERLQTAISS